MTTTPVSAALELIRFAKRVDDPVSAATAVDLSTAGLDADQLRSVLRLIWPYMAQLYACFRLSKDTMDLKDAKTFAELTAMLGDLDASGGE